ncbi:MAG: hypothetical protein B0D92_06130 [Spirochaeta sp. LUC14_002_19_P3]|nr:MAG: hypothetical protein B0D92_06130 [Spirochaeta sp. LUC14_002_19_P3]
MIRTVGLFLAAAVFFLNAGCTKRRESAPERIQASTSIIGDIVSRIAGERADVNVLIGRGENPHSWEPTPRDMAELEESRLLFMNGLGLEEGLVPVLDSLSGLTVIDLSQGMDILGEEHDIHGETEHSGEEDRHDHEEEHSEQTAEEHWHETDPHLWLSPRNVIIWTHSIAEALAAADPDNGDAYREAAAGYREELALLDEEMAALMGSIPPERRKLLTGHSSMAYFARDYGLVVIDSIIPHTSDRAELSARHLSRFEDMFASEGIPAIFIEEGSPRAVMQFAETLARQSRGGASVVILKTGALSKEGERGSDYIDFIRYNAEQIAHALKDGR